MRRLKEENAIFVFVDIQEKFEPLIYEMDKILEKITILAKTVKIMELPFIVTEQYPKGLGKTLKPIVDSLPSFHPIEKLAFSCWGEENFRKELLNSNKRQVVISGIETHVCVLQTVLDLLDNGFEVYLVSDAVSSRFKEMKETALAEMRNQGAHVVPTESILFMLLDSSKHPHFKEVQKLIK